MLPQKPSHKSQYVKPKRKTRKRAHAHLFSEPNPTSDCLPFPSLPSSLYASPFLWLWLGRVLRFMKQLRVAFAVRKNKNTNKNKTKRNQLESSRVELSWAEQRAANSNLTPSGQAVGQLGQLDSLPIADYCNVVVWHAGQCTSHAHSGLRQWVI